jgi:hypothetical protein
MSYASQLNFVTFRGEVEGWKIHFWTGSLSYSVVTDEWFINDDGRKEALSGTFPQLCAVNLDDERQEKGVDAVGLRRQTLHQLR